ncbi:MAG TPA: 23S rRNA (uracil(1939)-C(5))-methyltransferase RlmD [Dissulfurispiraceae bacterium]|nr:23S rRNA (uracil(1939)-C(5))-methyltransferase RlmD [Dissulfurispiraceae bacterium]
MKRKPERKSGPGQEREDRTKKAESNRFQTGFRSVLLRAEKPAYGGSVIARHDNRVIFVEGALPGELVAARITEKKKDYAKAETVTVVEPSPDREEPVCPHFGECGGCQLQHIRYERQISLKEDVLLDTLRRLGKLSCTLSEPIADESPWAYRHRAQFKTDGSRTGFYRKSSRSVVDVGHCPVVCAGINTAYAAMRTLSSVSAYAEFFAKLNGITLISNNAKTAALFPARPGVLPDAELLQQILQKTGISGCIVLSARGVVASAGDSGVDFLLGGLVYHAAVDSFFQGHWRLNERVVASACEALSLHSGMRVLDLYAGAGNFSLPLAAHAQEVVAVEAHPRSIAHGRMNCERNQISNVRFVEMRAEHYEPEGRFHAVLLDPPRPGLSTRVVDTVLRCAPERIVYVSCNPATLARDLRKLCGGYDLVSLRLIDFFPHTFHIESMAVLRKG